MVQNSAAYLLLHTKVSLHLLRLQRVFLTCCQSAIDAATSLWVCRSIAVRKGECSCSSRKGVSRDVRGW